MVAEEQFEIFLELLDHISDTTISNYIREVGKFNLPMDINTPDTRVIYYYGGKLSEAIFKQTARYIKKNYPSAEIVCLEGKGHCEDALLNPEVRIRELSSALEI